MAELVEVRIPTYKRPVLLKRALKSLVGQGHIHWLAFIFDDSPEKEAKQVVESFDDDRLVYFANPENLGGAANIDKCFQGDDLGGGDYACILEDDNWWYESFLSRNITDLKRAGCSILQRNQQVWNQFEDRKEDTGRTTRGRWLSEGRYKPREMKACLFLFEGISNGGLFWRTNLESNLVVGPTVEDSGLQEYARTLQLEEPIHFAEEPLAVWSRMENEMVTRSISADRIWSRGRQSVMRQLVKAYGSEILDLAEKHAAKSGRKSALERAFLEAGIMNRKPAGLPLTERLTMLAKGFIKRQVVADPLMEYWRTGNAIIAEQ